ncbi:hypothetical protein [Bacillus sp. FSL K6-3431]|uniref:hypothetical protein n=1 Tax=Bacillus sp. FSL K6-3431 TaxID=2921500 RepID=UPI0030F6E9B2
MTTQNAKDQFDGVVASAIHMVNKVLPDMLKKNEGALLFTTGLSAMSVANNGECRDRDVGTTQLYNQSPC